MKNNLSYLLSGIVLVLIVYAIISGFIKGDYKNATLVLLYMVIIYVVVYLSERRK